MATARPRTIFLFALVALLLQVGHAEIFVHLIAPADVRKDGGLKFRANLPVPDTVDELKNAFRLAHLERHGAPGYEDNFEFFHTRTEEVLASIDQLEDGDELRLFRKRGGGPNGNANAAGISAAGVDAGAAPLSGGTVAATKAATTKHLQKQEGMNTSSRGRNHGEAQVDENDELSKVKSTAKTDTSTLPPSSRAKIDITSTESAPSTMRLPEAHSPFYVSELLYLLTRAGSTRAEDRDKILGLLSETQLTDFQRKQILDDYPVDCNAGDGKGSAVSTSFRAMAESFVHLHPTARGIIRLAECDPAFRETLTRAQFARTWEQYGDLFSSLSIVGKGDSLFVGGNAEDQEQFFPGYIGQKDALEMVKPLVLEQMLQRRISDAPLSFLFLGPSGVGKTELARKVAERIHCGQPDGSPTSNASPCNVKQLTRIGKFVEFKMGNYRNEEQFTSWIGVPDGVKGSDGKLSEVLASNPDAVIYLDEIEKAIPSAGDLLLSMLDNKGSVQVSKTGQHISTVRATFILSSNLATNEILATWQREGGGAGVYGKILEKLDYTLSQSKMFARPELRNRIAAIVPFTPFRASEVRQVILLELHKLQKSYKNSAGWGRPNIVWSDKVVEYLADPVRNIHFDNAVSRGNLRELIRFLEQTVNRALNAAKDCEAPRCELLEGPQTQSSPFSAAPCRPKASDLFDDARSDNFVLDVSGDVIVAHSVPVTLREALAFCEIYYDAVDADDGEGSSGLFGRVGSFASQLGELGDAGVIAGGVVDQYLGLAASWWGKITGEDQSVRAAPRFADPSASAQRAASAAQRWQRMNSATGSEYFYPGAPSSSSSTGGSSAAAAGAAHGERRSSAFERERDYDLEYLWAMLFEYRRLFSIAVAWTLFFAIGFWTGVIGFVVVNYAVLPLGHLAYVTWTALPKSVQHVVLAGGRVVAQVGKQAVKNFDVSLMCLLFLEYRYGLVRYLLRRGIALVRGALRKARAARGKLAKEIRGAGSDEAADEASPSRSEEAKVVPLPATFTRRDAEDFAAKVFEKMESDKISQEELVTALLSMRSADSSAATADRGESADRRMRQHLMQGALHSALDDTDVRLLASLLHAVRGACAGSNATPPAASALTKKAPKSLPQSAVNKTVLPSPGRSAASPVVTGQKNHEDRGRFVEDDDDTDMDMSQTDITPPGEDPSLSYLTSGSDMACDELGHSDCSSRCVR